MAIAAMASRRALSVTSRPGMVATERATGQYTAGAVASQNWAMAVCSGVRWVLFMPAERLDLVEVPLPHVAGQAGGGPGRNWSPLVITHGRRLPQWGTAGDAVGT